MPPALGRQTDWYFRLPSNFLQFPTNRRQGNDHPIPPTNSFLPPPTKLHGRIQRFTHAPNSHLINLTNYLLITLHLSSSDRSTAALPCPALPGKTRVSPPLSRHSHVHPPCNFSLENHHTHKSLQKAIAKEKEKGETFKNKITPFTQGLVALDLPSP